MHDYNDDWLKELEATGKVERDDSGVEVEPHIVAGEQKGWNWTARKGRVMEIGWEASRHQAESAALTALGQILVERVRLVTRSGTAALGG